jgi:kynurenine formamidase
VIDVSTPASMDADYRLTEADVGAWEQTHGRIADGAVVLLRTGWGRHWNNIVRYQNRDVQGRLHFPGFSAEAATLLIVERGAKGIGIDTLSIDYGLSRDFAVHHIVNRAGRYGLENVARLEQLPPRGFYLVAAPIKIETGSGGPARIFAIVP